MQICAAAMEPATAAGSLFTFPSYAFPFHLLPSIVKKNMAQLEGRSLHITLCCKHSKIFANLYEEISKSSNLDVNQVPKVSTEWCSHVPGGAGVCVASLERTAVTPSWACVDSCVCASVSVCVRLDLAVFRIYSPSAPRWRCESITGERRCSAVGQTPWEASSHTYRSWLQRAQPELWPRASGVNWFSKVATQGPGDRNDTTPSLRQPFTHTPLKTMSHFLIHLSNTHTSICDVLLKHICQHSRHPQNLSSRVRFFA